MAKKKISLDELMAHRSNGVVSAGGKQAILKAAKEPASWDEDKRTARFILSTESVDRYGDVVVQAGLQTEKFEKNPQALLFHKSSSWPVGSWSDLAKVNGRPKRTEGTLNFLAEGVEEDADRAARHVAAGSIRAVSIGFIPLEWEFLDDEHPWDGVKFLASELLEASLVPLPANADCIVRDAGGDMKLARELIEDVLDNWARDPATGLLLERKDYESAYRVVKAKAFDDLVVKQEVQQPTGDMSETVETVAGAGLASAEVVFVDGNGKEISETEFDKDPGPGCEKEFVSGYADDLAAAEYGDEFAFGVDKNGDDYVAVIRDGNIAFSARFDDKAVAEKAVADRLLALDEEENPAIETLELKVDTSQVDDATEKVGALALLADSVSAKLKNLFGRSAEQERIEPVIDTPPSPEAIAAAMSKVRAARECGERALAKSLS